MDYRKRPRCVSVIGWFWILMGCFGSGFACFHAFAFTTLLDSMVGARMSQLPVEIGNMLLIVRGAASFVAIFSLFVAGLSIVSAIAFMRLKSWARLVLEILTWVFLLAGVGLMVFGSWIWGTSGMPLGAALFLIAMHLVIFGPLVVPFVLVLWCLRGEKLRTAMDGSAKHDAAQDGESAGAAPPSVS